MTDDLLKSWIKKCEGIQIEPYLDTTGNLTIGYGRNLSSQGISATEADFLFQNDFNRAKNELQHMPWFDMQPEGVKGALINMNFNLGIERLLSFKKMIKALSVKDYTNAAVEALDSTWANQVGQRAKDIALMIREGK
jgi:lysozyme